MGEIITDNTNNHRLITIDNVGKRNALSSNMIESITEEFVSLNELGDYKPVVLTGKGQKAFCSGYDISSLDSDAEDLSDNINGMMSAIRNYDYPTIARLNGDVIGGGVLLAGACDIKVAVKNARFGIPSAKMGVVYQPSGIEMLINTVGINATTELLLSGELFTTKKAQDIGFVSRITDGEEIDNEIESLVDNIARNAPLSMIWTKDILNAVQATRGFNEGEIQWIKGLRSKAMNSDDYKEAQEAFLEDRDPHFKGK